MLRLRIFFLQVVCLFSSGRILIEGQQGIVPSQFSRWLQSQVLLLPAEKFNLPGTLDIDFAGGNCSNIEVGRSNASAVGLNGDTVSLLLGGLGIQCSLRLSRPHTVIDLGVNNTEIKGNLVVTPHSLPDGTKIPLGDVSFYHCAAKVNVAYKNFRSWEVNGLFQRVEAMVVNRLVSVLLCRTITAKIDEWGRGVLDRAARVAKSLVHRTPEAPPPGIVKLVDWSAFPPVQLVRSLIETRLPKMMQTETMAAILRFGGRNIFTSISEAAGIPLGTVNVGGAVTPTLPAVEIGANASTMSFGLGLSRLQIDADIGLVLNPLSTWLPLENGTGRRLQAPVVQPGTALQENFHVQVTFDNLSFVTQALAMADEQRVLNLEVDQLQQLGCLSSVATQASSIPNRSVHFETMAFNSIPGLLQVGEPGTLESDLFATLGMTAFHLLHDSGNAMASLSRGAANLWIEEWLSSTESCPPSEVFYGMPLFTNACLTLGAIMLCVACALACCGCLGGVDACCPGQKPPGGVFGELLKSARGRNMTEEDSESFNGDLAPMQRDQSGCDSLCFHPATPDCLKLSYPFLIFATFWLFLYGDFSLGCTLQVVFEYADHSVTIGPIFSFSLISIIKDSFAAGAMLFGILALTLSGIWPLVKLAMLLAAWLFPASLLSVPTRGCIVNFLDQYGKYSLIDIWLGIIGLASYHIEWHGPDASIKVQPVVLEGFFTFILATVVSLILGHVAAICHEHAQAYDDELLSIQAPPALLSADQEEDLSDDGVEECGISEENREPVCCLMMCAFPMLIPLILIGGAVPSFQMSLVGVAAEMLLDPADQTIYYSLISLGTGISAANPEAMGLKVIQWVLYFFTLLVPIVLAFALFCLAVLRIFRPHRKKELVRLIRVCRILDAWGALDVFAVAVIVSALEIHLFAKYLVLYDNISKACTFVVDSLNMPCIEASCSVTMPGYLLLSLAGFLSWAIPKIVFQCYRDIDHHPGNGSSMGSKVSSMGSMAHDSDLD